MPQTARITDAAIHIGRSIWRVLLEAVMRRRSAFLGFDTV